MPEKFVKDEDGQSMVEYVLILAFIALLVVGGLTILGEMLTEKYNSFSNMFD